MDEEVISDKDTSIRISKEALKLLRNFERDPRQSNESIINQLMVKARELKELKKRIKQGEI